MVLPLGDGHIQLMQRITFNADGTHTTESFDKFSFVPMLEGKQD